MLNYIIAITLLLLGIILLYVSIKKQKKKRVIFYIKEKDPFQIEGKTSEDLLKSITYALKHAIKIHYGISEKLSLREIIGELEKKENPFFLDIAKSLEEYQYTKKTPTKAELINIKNKFLEEKRRKEKIDEKEEEKKRKEMTILEKLVEKEKELKEKTRIEKIRLRKLKRNPKVSKNPQNQK